MAATQPQEPLVWSARELRPCSTIRYRSTMWDSTAWANDNTLIRLGTKTAPEPHRARVLFKPCVLGADSLTKQQEQANE